MFLLSLPSKGRECVPKPSLVGIEDAAQSFVHSKQTPWQLVIPRPVTMPLWAVLTAQGFLHYPILKII